MKSTLKVLAALALVGVASKPVALQAAAPYQMENLGRGVVAVRTGASSVYVGWRLLGLDPSTIAFNVYRGSTKLNASPITATTNFVDNGATFGSALTYTVRPVLNGVEQAASAGFTLPANAATQQFLNIPLQVPQGGKTPDGVSYTYTAGDASVGDLDGDGEYEIVVKWDPSNAKDNSQAGLTGNVFLDAYKLNGKRLWRIDLGRNIRAGAHYTQFIVYDLDGDGKAEVACKTADGTISGTGQVIGNGSADWRDLTPNPASGRIGYVLHGPEFLTVFNGQTGAVLATTNYIPGRGKDSDWGDNYGNRVDRFNAAVAYLDGVHPSLIMLRGYYTRTAIVAWDFRDGKLTQRWHFDTRTADLSKPDAGMANSEHMGNHQVSIGDVDGNGTDEIIFGALCINSDGTKRYTTGLGHGDAFHVSDMDPDHPGLETYGPHEVPSLYGNNGSEMHDAKTGAVLWGASGNAQDVGRGVAFDIDPRHRGYEAWSSVGGLFTCKGQLISNTKPPSTNFGVWWDADPLRELLDRNHIDKWDWNTGTAKRLLTATECTSNNGTKATPALSADILGDWREEVIWRTNDSTALHIYTTTIPATNRMYTLMHDRMYREAIAWQNSAYNQPPHPSFYLGDGMSAPPKPNMYMPGAVTPPPPPPPPGSFTLQAENATLAGGTVTESVNAGFHGTGYANSSTTGGSITFSNVKGNGGGPKTVTIRYALGITTARTGNLIVNGKTTAITFQPTGSWTTWQTVNVTMALTDSATNTIQFTTTGTDLANIDEITVP